MPINKMLMSQGIVGFGVHGVFGVPGVISLEVTGVVALGIPDKVPLLDTGKIVF